MNKGIIFNKYEVICKIGQGGTSEVYLVRNIKLDNLWAVKKINKKQTLKFDLLNEPHILKELQHPAIPKIVDIEEDEHYYYIIEEYIEGISLKKFRQQNGSLKEDKIIDFAIQLSDVIDYLHSLQPYPIIFQDLKPDNLIVTSGNKIKLIDFGIAKKHVVLNEANSKALGTIGYAAPEQYLAGAVDERTDVFSFGMTLYYLLTGIEPGLLKEEVLPPIQGYSQQLKKIVNKCVKSIPLERFEKVSDIKRKLIRIKDERIFKESNIKSSKPIIISVFGAQARIGATHLSIAIGNYLNRENAKVLVKENHPSDDFLAIQTMYNDISEKDNYFTIKGMDMMCFDESIELEELFDKSYQFIVLDQGVYSEEAVKNSVYSDIKIIVSGGKEWEIEYFEKILYDLREDTSYIYLINFVNQQLYRELIKHMGKLSCYKVAYQPNPFILTDLCVNNFQDILNDYLPKSKGKKSLKQLLRRSK
ncbi:MAG: serine/threonine-protein kinase [Eubacteriales bacterium]